MKSDQTKKELRCWRNRVRGLMVFFNIVFNTMLASHDNEDDYIPLFLPHIGAEVTKEQIVDIFRKRNIGEVVHVLLGKGKKGRSGKYWGMALVLVKVDLASASGKKKIAKISANIGPDGDNFHRMWPYDDPSLSNVSWPVRVLE